MLLEEVVLVHRLRHHLHPLQIDADQVAEVMDLQELTDELDIKQEAIIDNHQVDDHQMGHLVEQNHEIIGVWNHCLLV